MKKSIGIVAATELEIAPLKGKKNFSLCITGIGGVNTTYHLLQFIKENKISILIQAGIAGCFSKEVPLASVFIIDKDRFGDLGVMEEGEWKDFFDLQLSNAHEAPFKDGWLINNNCQAYNPNHLKAASSISVNEISTSKTKMQLLSGKYNPVTESMEGAAFHYVCLKQKIPFLQLRSISNYAGERNKSKWDIEKSILHLNKELADIIDFISLEK
ncbi:MAG TPA: futalosine hydrolase [Chitinophagaceae bacterium]|jgi:futalosine nucleosidase